MYNYDLIELIIATILGVNVGFYIGYLCGKEKTYKDTKPHIEDTIKELEKFKYKHYHKYDVPKHINMVGEDKPFVIEDDDDIFLKINNVREEII